MMTPFPPKSVRQMRREAEQRGKPQPKPKPPVPLDPSKRPKMASKVDGVEDAAADWLAHLAAGRIQVR